MTQRKTLISRYRQLNLWNKFAFWGSIVSITGFSIAYFLPGQPNTSGQQATIDHSYQAAIYQANRDLIINSPKFPDSPGPSAVPTPSPSATPLTQTIPPSVLKPEKRRFKVVNSIPLGSTYSAESIGFAAKYTSYSSPLPPRRYQFVMRAGTPDKEDINDEKPEKPKTTSMLMRVPGADPFETAIFVGYSLSFETQGRDFTFIVRDISETNIHFSLIEK